MMGVYCDVDREDDDDCDGVKSMMTMEKMKNRGR